VIRVECRTDIHRYDEALDKRSIKDVRSSSTVWLGAVFGESGQ
jgi:hypothetical protein